MFDFQTITCYVFYVYQRFLKPLITEALEDTPVVLLTGARQVGKSTLANKLVPEEARFSFDDLRTLSFAQTDPIGFVSRLPSACLVDEVQRVPDIFLPLKARVDRERKTSRFLLTGSANVLMLPKLADSLAGRLAPLTLYPLSQGELLGNQEHFIDKLFRKAAFSNPPDADIVDPIVKGGYPEVQTRSERRRQDYFSDYLTTLVERDIQQLANIERRSELPNLLALLAAWSGGLLNTAAVSRDIGLNTQTLRRYLALLEASYLIYMLPAWHSNIGKRLVKAPKVYFVDTGISSYLLGVETKTLLSDRKRLGQLLENFVASELQRQLSWSKTRARLYYFRSHDGLEVDFILESQPGQLVGIEVKASETVSPSDFRGLEFLASQLGKRFVGGCILYQGNRVFPFAENLSALPIQTLWLA